MRGRGHTAAALVDRGPERTAIPAEG